MLIIPAAVFLITLIIIINWHRHSYWKTRNIWTPPFFPFVGHYFTFLGNRWEKLDKIYEKNKSNKVFGMYECLTPTLFVSDPNIVRDVLVKEFDHFPEGRPFRFANDKYFDEMLFLVTGPKWKALRSLLTPTFTSGKIKAMFPLVLEKADELVLECEKEMNKNGFVEIHSLLGFYTMDTIASCAFGINANCLQKKKDSEFYKSSFEFFELNFFKVVKFTIMTISPTLFNLLKIQIGSELNFLASVIDQTINARRESKQKRGDFLDILLDSLDDQSSKEQQKYPMTMNTVKAQAILFLLAGFETSGTSLAITVYNLAKNVDAQEKLRNEITKIVHSDGSFDYQGLMECHYLEACLAEALRVDSPVHFLERLCVKNFKIPEVNFTIPEGMIVQIPSWSLHRDPNYWEDPLTYNPDRFMPENKATINPYTYMPFGHGPRNCIGMRFAHQTVKLAIAKLCYNFEFSLRPGYEKLNLISTVDTLRPDDQGVQLIMKKIRE